MSTVPPQSATLDLSLLAPEYVRRLARYLPGKPIGELAREFGLDERDIVKLASNENPRGPSPRCARRSPRRPTSCPATRTATASSSRPRWPRATRRARADRARQRLERHPRARHAGVPAAGRPAVYSRHAFAVYPLATQARGATGIEVPARDFGHDLPAMRAAITPTTRIVFVANPEQSDRHVAPAGRAARVHRLGAGRRARRARRGVQRVSGPGAARAERQRGSRRIRTSSCRGRSPRPTDSRRCASATASWTRRSPTC